MIEKITSDRLRELVIYNPITGVFVRRKKTAPRINVGDVAGTKSNGYLVACLDSKVYLCHRLAWLYSFKEWPENQIDHINGNRSDNRICNLRAVNMSENGKNQRMHSTNTSGRVGVSWSKMAGKWQAAINANKKAKHLGFFASFEAAVSARELAEIKYGYHSNHGNKLIEGDK